MEVLTSILNFFDTVLWSSPLIYISIFVGLLYTVGLKGFQVRYLKQMVNSVFEKSADSESSTSFEAFALTVAARETSSELQLQLQQVALVQYSGCGLWQFWERQHLLQKIR